MPKAASPDVRIMRIVSISQWFALAVGIFAGIVITDGSVESFVAAATGGLYVLATSGLPLSVLKRPLVLEAVSLSGSLLTMTSVALTGGVRSPYLVLSIIPPVASTVLGGTRRGLTTATLTGALLIAISLSSPDETLIPALGIAALFLLVTYTVGQIRRLLDDLEQRAKVLEESTFEASRRLDELATTNDLLTRLASLASENTGPINVGRTALETITGMIPGSSGTALLSTEEGAVVIAQYGNTQKHHIRTRIPLTVGSREVGAILLASDEPLDTSQHDVLARVVEPVALSFANLLLLQQIARTAVKEERSRLARELHDEIGPTLASLGLALDTAALEAGEPGLADHLSRLRGSVSTLVDDVRATVADLRSSHRGSLSTRLNEALHSLPPPPSIDVGLDERRPPRPSMIDDIAAVVVEAARNAYFHSGTDRIRIHGWVDFERGRVVVEDRGSGFDVSAEHPGHYGLVGMHERAQRIEAELVVVSTATGTSVALEWGSP